MSTLRVGIGYDSHRLESGRELWLAGIQIPFEKGLVGHSDADVLLHAISDAVCGACGLPDIGMLFPDTETAWAGANSSDLLTQIMVRVRQAGWHLVNVDAVLIAQAPKIAPYVPQMRSHVATLLQLEHGCVNIRGKTAEKLGPLGAGEGMAAHAVCLADRLGSSSACD
jgi:2-C-methyl-D-erythritol 2,4-cyclodiphosphate synthase